MFTVSLPNSDVCGVYQVKNSCYGGIGGNYTLTTNTLNDKPVWRLADSLDPRWLMYMEYTTLRWTISNGFPVGYPWCRAQQALVDRPDGLWNEGVSPYGLSVKCLGKQK